MQKLALLTLCLTPAFVFGGQMKAEFENIDDYTDFSVYGLSEQKTLDILKAEWESELKEWGERYLADGETLTVTFTDIDMAGDIQPWRNRTNADIRYVESVYPPRLRFKYTLIDADGEVLNEGEENLTDLGYQMNTSAVIRNRYEHFFYESELMKDWVRDTFKKRSDS